MISEQILQCAECHGQTFSTTDRAPSAKSFSVRGGPRAAADALNGVAFLCQDVISSNVKRLRYRFEQVKIRMLP